MHDKHVKNWRFEKRARATLGTHGLKKQRTVGGRGPLRQQAAGLYATTYSRGKYKAKIVLDTFTYRMSGCAGMLIFLRDGIDNFLQLLLYISYKSYKTYKLVTISATIKLLREENVTKVT